MIRLKLLAFVKRTLITFLLKLPFASYILIKYFERKTKIEFILAQAFPAFQLYNDSLTVLNSGPSPNESHQLSQPSKSTCWLDTQELSAFRGLSQANAPGRHVTPPTNPLHLFTINTIDDFSEFKISLLQISCSAFYV